MAKRGKAAKARPAKAKKRAATKRPAKSKATKPSKRKKSQPGSHPSKRSQAAATRTKRQQAAAAAQRKKDRANAKRRTQAKRRKAERESAELGELERKREQREANKRRKSGDEYQLLADVLAEMRNRGSMVVPLSLTLTEAEAGARIPWLVVGRFDVLEVASYAELNEIFEHWRDDLILEAQIHPQRLSQIRIVYEDPHAKRGESDSIVSHTGPWEAVISEVTAELDPDDEDSLSQRYQDTTVPHFYVYFSGHLATEATIRL